MPNLGLEIKRKCPICGKVFINEVERSTLYRLAKFRQELVKIIVFLRDFDEL